MIEQLFESKEKKVEYIELIYDLIFVYIIGRNNALLHIFENGFVAWPAFFAYVLTTLAVIQIWNYSTYYINIYGRHSVREHVFLFVNMFLLYFIGEGTRVDWQGFHTQYHVAWALILINIGVQYLIELRHHEERENQKQIIRMVVILFVEALIVLADIPLYQATQTTWLSLIAIVFGVAAVLMFGQRNSGTFVDFSHLSERAMLYVVFTFGEMIIAIASYFNGEFSLRSTYFALMAFLIIVGLFVSYGVFYDHILDRDKETNGLSYMILHLFMIFALNNITNGLEFMQEERVQLLPKVAYLVCAFLLYYGCLFALMRYARNRMGLCRQFLMPLAVIAISFVALMIVLREHMLANIAVSVLFVYAMFLRIYLYGKKQV